MTLGSVARVAMEYRQHLQMFNNVSKLTFDLSSAAAAAAAVKSKLAAVRNSDKFTSECWVYQ